MQNLLETGKVKAIGVSNFQITHLERLLSHPSCKVVPAVNQIEVRLFPILLSRLELGLTRLPSSSIPITPREFSVL
jgi:predicted oxidoreductase